MGVKIFDRADGSRLYSDGGTAVVLLDAEWQLEVGDLRRAATDLAMACELFIQAKVLRTLPRRLAPSVRKYVERAFAGVKRDKFFADALTPAQQQAWTEIRQHIGAIADRRNDVVHKGSLTGGAAELKANIAHAKTLLSLD